MVYLLILNDWVPLYQHGLTLIPAWTSSYIHYKVWNEITYPFTNFNGCEWIINFIPYFTGDVITHPSWDQSQSMSVKGVLVLPRARLTNLRVCFVSTSLVNIFVSDRRTNTHPLFSRAWWVKMSYNIYNIQCGTVITRSVFSKFLTINIH